MKKTLDLINIFNKLAGYIINIQKQIFYIPTMNTLRNKAGKKILLTIASKKNIYIGINLTKDVKDLYNKNYKLLNKEIKQNIRKWKAFPSL
jgi:hypothetical protein